MNSVLTLKQQPCRQGAVRASALTALVACVKGEDCVSGRAEISIHALGSRLWVRIGGSTLARTASQCSWVAPLLRGKGTLYIDLHSRDMGEGFLLSRTVQCAWCAWCDCCCPEVGAEASGLGLDPHPR